MRKCPTADHYEYVATYVDDLCMIMKDPQSLLDQLMAPPYNFKLKGSGELAFHLGCGFHQDSTSTLCMDPGKYVKRMEEVRSTLQNKTDTAREITIAERRPPRT